MCIYVQYLINFLKMNMSGLVIPYTSIFIVITTLIHSYIKNNTAIRGVWDSPRYYLMETPYDHMRYTFYKDLIHIELSKKGDPKVHTYHIPFTISRKYVVSNLWDREVICTITHYDDRIKDILPKKFRISISAGKSHITLHNNNGEVYAVLFRNSRLSFIHGL
jgi:hypothetical protein